MEQKNCSGATKINWARLGSTFCMLCTGIFGAILASSQLTDASWWSEVGLAPAPLSMLWIIVGAFVIGFFLDKLARDLEKRRRLMQ